MIAAAVGSAWGIVEQLAHEVSDLRFAVSDQTLNRCELPHVHLPPHCQSSLTESVCQVSHHRRADLRGAVGGRGDTARRHAVALVITMIVSHLRERRRA